MLGETEGVNTPKSPETKVFNTFRCTDNECGDCGVLRKFKGCCTPRCKQMYKHYIVQSRMKKEGEPFKNYFWKFCS